MITIERTVDIPPDRRLVLDLPKTVPGGRANMIMVLSREETSTEIYADDDEAFQRILSHKFPTVEEMRAEAARKAAERQAYIEATGVDPQQKFCGCLKDVFDEDGAAIQRRMRDEWPD
jgi:hypothetical protein